MYAIPGVIALHSLMLWIESVLEGLMLVTESRIHSRGLEGLEQRSILVPLWIMFLAIEPRRSSESTRVAPHPVIGIAEDPAAPDIVGVAAHIVDATEDPASPDVAGVAAHIVDAVALELLQRSSQARRSGH